ncbi:MAG: cellulase family glycosylhydrolase [Isosphaeraceae bacterium]
MIRLSRGWNAFPTLLALATFAPRMASAAPPATFIKVAPGGAGFVVGPENRPFVPWGFNYDHDEAGRLIEDYWEAEWPKVEADFAEMKDLGANVVRIHLQVGKFLKSATEARPEALERLGMLLALAEKTGLYLDLTGLACYRKSDTPAWFDALDEPGRWAAQRVFWKAVAGRCKDSPAVFCHDLMNEPVVPGGQRKPGDWLGPPFGGPDGFCFVQFVTLDQAGRPRPEIAAAWVKALANEVREADPNHLVTVGLVPWSLQRPGLTSGFVPSAIAADLDFLCVHLYPERGKLDEAMETLKGFKEGAGGKPLVIEETFSLKCGPEELREFVERSKSEKLADGWVGFYWGKTLEECEASKTLPDALMAAWLKMFRGAKP